ncbi:glycosyltransferase involved in cell wall biosynthesis [Hydrogenophaga palleronii]|uniref:Glycosyltransferase involved in cell wall biosynthesis n=1 Tax=Hydrogenophaga palleronii TaxID=65655 RepID=A0ABU1WGC0_9BURK|nr:glycosyltransferase [Hydrogenophaga palleronii]MDR7148316.1 glycosyltransferase involved in cell wall biosynthesis [Hydrogenophaga palleronii]
MKILYVAGREETYSRTRIVLRALREKGHEVITCLPPDRSFKNYPRLLWNTLLKAPQCDVVLVGFYGQLLVPFVRLLTWKPIVFDMYIGTYETMVFDRQKTRPGTLMARIYALADWLAYKMSNATILDTDHVIACVGKVINSDTRKFHRVFLAVDDSAIYPREADRRHDGFLVHFHGEFSPFHGVRIILQAAKLLEDQNVQFQIIGRGITYEEDTQLARDLGLKNVTFVNTVPYSDLAIYMSRADVCLGIFGDNSRAQLVLTNKAIETIGMAKPLITRLNQPVQELFTHRESALLIEPGNPQALADAILELQANPTLRESISRKAHEIFLANCTISQLGAQLDRIVRSVVKRNA